MMVEFYLKIRFSKDNIETEIKKIKTSDKIRNQILSICNEIELNVLNKIWDVNDSELIIELITQLKKFDFIIRELEDSKENSVLILLRCYVWDMLWLIHDETPELFKEYRRNFDIPQKRICITPLLNQLWIGDIDSEAGIDEFLDKRED